MTTQRTSSLGRVVGVIAGCVVLGLTAPLRAGDKPALVTSVLRLDPEIDCPSCEDGIKHSLVTAHGVQSASIDVLTNRIVIRYDPSNINLKALIGRIRVYGYAASEVK